MIRGYCIGGGLGVAVMLRSAHLFGQFRFAVPAAKLGLGYAYAGLKRLVDIVGPSFAKEIFYTARQFDAQEAFAMGLVNRVVPPAELETTSKTSPTRSAPTRRSPSRRRSSPSTKSSRTRSKRDIAGVDAAVEACFASSDYAEGRTAFMEKRKPKFTGS